MNTPEEALAKAARIISEVDYPNYMDDPKFATRVLEAAAPYIQAAALREFREGVKAEIEEAEPPNYEEDNYAAGWVHALGLIENRLANRADKLEAPNA